MPSRGGIRPDPPDRQPPRDRASQDGGPPMPRDAATWSLMGMLATSLIAAAAVAGGPYDSSIETWREKRAASLKADDGWLTVCGLAWLRPGTMSLGSDPSNDVVLPAHAPASVGAITLEQGKVSFRAAPGAKVTCDGKPFEAGAIRSDADEHPDVLAVGDVKLLLLKRGSGWRCGSRTTAARSAPGSPGSAGIARIHVADHGEVRRVSPAGEDVVRHDRRRAGHRRKPRLRHIRLGQADVSPPGGAG